MGFSLSIRAHYQCYFLQVIDAAEHDTELALHLIANLPGKHEDLRERDAEISAVVQQVTAIINA